MHFTKEDIRRYLLGRLPLPDASRLEEHLRSCQACQNELNAAVEGLRESVRMGRRAAADSDRRREMRFRVDEPATVHVLLAPASRTDGRIIEASKGGLKLRVGRPLLPGALLQVRSEDTIAMGEVRHCVRVGSEFEVGVQLIDVTRILPREGKS